MSGPHGLTQDRAPDLVPRQMRVAKYQDGHWDDECEEDGGSETEGRKSDAEDDTCERLRSIDFVGSRVPRIMAAKTDSQSQLVFGPRDPGLTSLGRAQCKASNTAFQALAHRGIRTPSVRFVSNLERTHETDKLVFQGIGGSKYSSYPIVVKVSTYPFALRQQEPTVPGLSRDAAHLPYRHRHRAGEAREVLPEGVHCA